MDIARDKEMYLESCETSMTGFFAKTLTFFSHQLCSQKGSIVNVWQSPKSAPLMLSLLNAILQKQLPDVFNKKKVFLKISQK